MELIIDPSVLFLDEPTTGLDASTANSVLALLKRYTHAHTFTQARYHICSTAYYYNDEQDPPTVLFFGRMSNHGRTIILSIHQPRYSIYRLFDTLTLLVAGRQVYHGPAQSALDYFSDIGA